MSHTLRLGAALCAASGLVLQPWIGLKADCYANSLDQPQSETEAAAAATQAAARLAALAGWLQQQGADIDAIHFKQSDTDAGRFGVYAGDGIKQRAARSLWGRVAGWAGLGRNAAITIASFPLSSTLTAANLVQHPQQGPILAELMQLGLADDRTAVILHLVVERQRLREHGSGFGGSGSNAWLLLLPGSFSTTLYFSELDMQWLKGTTLHKATRLRQQNLQSAWARLQPAAKQLAEASGLQGAPTLDDWLWANSVFWSRAIAFPSPDTKGSIVMREGIVPGLDFCNHATGSPCKWTVFGAAEAEAKQRQGSQPDAVSLVCPRQSMPPPGAEVTIDYGGKSNEELLFLYGFALPENEHEVLTVMCPLSPPGEWDEQLLARLALLQRRGLRPQLHLPLADLPRSPSSSSKNSSTGPAAGLLLPEGVAETLEVFVLEPQQVQQQLEAGDAGDAGRSSATAGSGSSSGSLQEQSGLRLAVLSTLVRLLELKVLEMEGEEGTGLLEQDEQLLAAAFSSLPRNQRHALLYRIGQKRLAREYLAYAKQLLQQEMACLQQLQQTNAAP